jgi:tRNA wybutosine-synthesizing protein 2
MREKMRVLNLSSVRQEEVSGEGVLGSTCTAVDLYAGIGYFAFCYKKAGVKKVLCWELNPWSIEGLRRGAELNGWGMQVVEPIPKSTSQTNATDVEEEVEAWKASVRSDADFLVFQQSNEFALDPIMALEQHSKLPPVRHVNCGFLPSSHLSWPTAIRVIDEKVGGWIHAHENVGVKDIEARREEVEKEMQGMLDEWFYAEGGSGRQRKRRVRCEHVERVKTYAPGVVHVVFDVWVDGTRIAE